MNNVSCPHRIKITTLLKVFVVMVCAMHQLPVSSQVSSSYNFVLTNNVRKSGVTDPAQITSLTSDELMQSISYLDGRGRVMQDIIIQGSPLKQDMVSFTSYDNLGRMAVVYLPYVNGNTGAFKTGATASQASFYQSLKSNGRAFTETKFENSPQSRVTEQIPEGSEWLAANKKQTTAYSTNVVNEVRLWNFDVATKTASTTSNYPANSLYKTVTTDEDDFLTIEFKDKSENVVCVQSGKIGSSLTTTYYVFDAYGNLRFVIPPEAVAIIGSGNFTIAYNDVFCQRWLYAFDYDYQLRPTQNLVPGAGTTYTVYDPFGRVILSQDQKMRSSNQWTFTKYDVFGRRIMTGIYRHPTSLSQSEMQTLVDDYYLLDATRKPYESRSSVDYAALHGYTNQAYPLLASPNSENSRPYQIFYFDDYDFDSNGIMGETAKGEPAYVNFGGSFASTYSNTTRGSATGSRMLVLGTTTFLTSSVFFDREGRAIQAQTENYTTGVKNFEIVSMLYDFSGRLMNSELRHRTLVTDNSFSLSLKERQTYDHGGRLIGKFIQVNDEPEEQVALHSYNEIDETSKKIIGVSRTLQSIDYSYNIRGWLSNINGTAGETGPLDYYTQGLSYNLPYSPGAGLYDGKVKQTKWKNDLSGKEKLFDFVYDDQNRLSGSSYKMNNGAGWNMDTDLFTENNISYDKNGNIKTLSRYSGPLVANKIDELNYDYGPGGNQVFKVTDSAPASYKMQGFKDGSGSGNDYSYDTNGNLTQDLNKGITKITYNILDLTDSIIFSNGSHIRFTYSADGEKLSMVYFNSANSTQKKFDYQGQFVYEDGNIQVILHDEGRLVPSTFVNLISNIATSQANTLEGFGVTGSVTLTSEQSGGQNYVKAVCGQAGGNPGVMPIGNTIIVKAGERYAFKVLGFQLTGTDAKLVIKNAASNADIVPPTNVLPISQTNETWVTTNFTVPAGVTQIKLGVLWDAGAVNKAIYINEIKLYKLDYEYQYFLTDHLGSPRVVLQTNPSSFTFIATMEGENVQNESSQFFNLRPANEIVFAGANATPGGNETLSMNVGYRVGPSRSFKVLPGDAIDASVMAYYQNGSYTKTPLATMSTYVVAALTGSLAPAVDGVNYSYANSGGTNPSFLLSPNQGSSKPSAFLNYILFDEAYRPIEAKSAPLGAAGVLHQVALPAISVKESGYLFVYLSYDNETGADVFFDDLKIAYTESPVVQINTYYPFGMTASVWMRDGEFQNRYLYQGKELDDNTLLQDFHARQYDPQLGRMISIDPEHQFGSGYLGMGNNPVIGVDPDGKFVNLIIAAAVGGIINWASHGGRFDKNGLKLFGVGALAGVAAGAVGLGVDVGVSFAQQGASFATGFQVGFLSFAEAGGVASLSAAGWTATSSFLAGAAIGGSAGFTSGFLNAFGNGIADGQGFQRSLGSGLREGSIAGFSGGLAGGIGGGIDAVRDGRRFFDGAKVYDRVLVDQANPFVHQSKAANCVAACGQSATNGRVTEAEIRNALAAGSDADKTGLGDGEMVKYIASRLGGRYKYWGKTLDPADALSHLRNGTKIFANLTGEQRHEVLLNKITERTIRKISGKVITKTLYYVMDPLKGQYTPINSSFLRTSNFWFWRQ